MALSDSFTRADSASSLGVADSGQTWTALSGTWGISSDKGYLASVTAQAVAVLDSGSGDGSFTVDVTLSGTSNRGDAGLVVRAADDDNYLLIALTKDGGVNALRLFKRVSGTFTLLATAMSGTLVNGTTYTVKVVYSGTTVLVYVDGVLQITFSTSTGLEANTKVGLRVSAGAGVSDDNASRFDNLARELVLITLGQATETGTAQPFGKAKARTFGQATETDSARSFTRVKRRSFAQAVETDSARPFTHFKSVRLGQAVETDQARPLTGSTVPVNTGPTFASGPSGRTSAVGATGRAFVSGADGRSSAFGTTGATVAV